MSVLTIVAFSSERYLAICYPLYLYTMSGLQRALKIICCLWLISFFSALPFSIYTKLNYITFDETQHIIKVIVTFFFRFQSTALDLRRCNLQVFATTGKLYPLIFLIYAVIVANSCRWQQNVRLLKSHWGSFELGLVLVLGDVIQGGPQVRKLLRQNCKMHKEGLVNCLPL